MKKIFLFIISAVLVLGLVLTGRGSVKATTENYIDTGITTDIPNSSNGSGCFIGFNEWLKTADDLYSFLELEFGQNCQNTDFIGRLGEQLIMAQNLGYIDVDFKPCILYISSEDLLNKWLRDNLFIEYGATYKEGITGVSNGEYSPVGKEGFHALHQLLRLRGELEVYILSPADIPGMFYKTNSEADSLTDTWYIFSEIKKPYVINNTWQYKSLEYDCPVEECGVLDIPDSVGKVNQVSSNTYEYVYSGVYYNDEFGYYSLSQSDTQTIQLTRNQLPSFVFDSNGTLKDVYISKQDNFWTMPEVKEVSKKLKLFYTFEKKMLNLLGNGICYFEVYFNFDLPVDTLEYIKFNLPIKKISKFLWWSSDVYIGDFTMTARRDENITYRPGNDWNNTWYQNFFTIQKIETSNLIEKGSFLCSNGKTYLFKIIYVDDKYSMYGDYEKSQIVWNDSNRNHPTAFDNAYMVDMEKDVYADCIYTYKSVIYKASDINVIPEPPNNYENNSNDPWWLQALKWIWEKICLVFSWIWSNKIIRFVTIALLFLLFIYIVLKIIVLIKSIKNKKSTN